MATNRTAFFVRRTNGMHALEDLAGGTGARFFVHYGTGTDAAGYGNSPDAPVKTLDYAIGLCTASKGDVIFLMPGHTETLAAAVTLDIIGVRVIGLGTGYLRPQFTIHANVDGFTVTAANVSIENVVFNEATAARTATINVAAADCLIKGCHFDLGQYDIDAITVTADGERLVVRDCVAIVTADGPDSWVKLEGVVDAVQILGNYVVGCDGTNPFDDGVIDCGSQAATNLRVAGNTFNGADQVTVVMANASSLVGDCVGPNQYAGSATDAETAGDTAEHNTSQSKIDSVGITASTNTSRISSVGIQASTVQSKVDSVGVTGSTVSSKVDSVGVNTSTITSKADSVGISASTLISKLDSVAAVVSVINSKT